MQVFSKFFTNNKMFEKMGINATNNFGAMYVKNLKQGDVKN